MPLPKRGEWLCLALVIFLSSCRTDQPPPIEPICTLDGLGGGNCVHSDGTKVYLKPSEMKNFWTTSPDGIAKFSAWCYDVPENQVRSSLETMKNYSLR